MSKWPPAKGHAAEYLARLRDEQEVLTRCSFCPWKFKGKAVDAREAAKEHRQEAHPELVKPKRRRAKRIWTREAA